MRAATKEFFQPASDEARKSDLPIAIALGAIALGVVGFVIARNLPAEPAPAKPKAEQVINQAAVDAGRALGHELGAYARGHDMSAPTPQALKALSQVRGDDCGYSGRDRENWEAAFRSGYRSGFSKK